MHEIDIMQDLHH
jgi:calcium-dependent protein kinase